jgi:hypothetical protein
LFAKIQRTGAGITKLTIQGHPKLLQSSLEYLRDLLQLQYGAATVWGDKSVVEDQDKLTSVTIEDTLPGLKRDSSSGEFLEQQFEEISFGGSATTENLKKIAKETFNNMLGGVRGIGIAKGWIPPVKKEHISVKHGDVRYVLEVSTIQTMESLIQAVEQKFRLPQPIKLLYTKECGDNVVITDVKDLRENGLYYVLTVLEELPTKQASKFSTMEQFFEKLKSGQELDEEDIHTIKDCFGNQKIKFKQLMETGELAMTEADLKDIGITQIGLRKAILAVIKSNQ